MRRWDAAALQELKAGEELSAQTQEVMATFRAIAELKRSLPGTISQYVVSGATAVEDALTVVELARMGGVAVEGGMTASGEHDPGLQPVLLFESIEDLRNAPWCVERCGRMRRTRRCWRHGAGTRR